LEGTGTVDTYVVVHHVYDPAFADDAPYVIAHVALDGTDNDVEMISNIVDRPWEEIRQGMPVEVTFDDVTPEVTLPRFRVRSTGHPS
jgi:uncharacterized OB-fold protein